MAYKTFTDLTTLYAADLNSFLMSQTVARFDSLTSRDAAITGPVVGQMCWTPTRGLQVHTGSVWAPAPGTVLAKLRRTATGNVSNGGTIQFDDEVFDLYLGHSTTALISRYVCPVEGNYIVHGSVHHAPINPLGGPTVLGHLFVNGSSVSTHAAASSSSPSTGTHLDFTDVVQASKDDYLELVVGNSLAAAANVSGTYMVVTYGGF